MSFRNQNVRRDFKSLNLPCRQPNKVNVSANVNSNHLISQSNKTFPIRMACTQTEGNREKIFALTDFHIPKASFHSSSTRINKSLTLQLGKKVEKKFVCRKHFALGNCSPRTFSFFLWCASCKSVLNRSELKRKLIQQSREFC